MEMDKKRQAISIQSWMCPVKKREREKKVTICQKDADYVYMQFHTIYFLMWRSLLLLLLFFVVQPWSEKLNLDMYNIFFFLAINAILIFIFHVMVSQQFFSRVNGLLAILFLLLVDNNFVCTIFLIRFHHFSDNPYSPDFTRENNMESGW